MQNFPFFHHLTILFFSEIAIFRINRPRSIYQYSNMAPRLSGQTSIFGVVFFVSKSLLGIERQKKLEKFAILTRKPRTRVRILIYRTWPIGNRASCRPIRSVIILVVNKSNSRCAVVRFCYHSYDYRPKWTPLSPIICLRN